MFYIGGVGQSSLGVQDDGAKVATASREVGLLSAQVVRMYNFGRNVLMTARLCAGVDYRVRWMGLCVPRLQLYLNCLRSNMHDLKIVLCGLYLLSLQQIQDSFSC